MTSTTLGPSRSGVRRGRAKGSPLARRRRRVFGPFPAPALILYTVLFMVPTVYSFYASFTSWDGFSNPRWKGTLNYDHLTHDPAFKDAFFNTMKLLFGCGIFLFVLSFAFMLMLREMKGRKFIQGFIFLPHIVSGVALAAFWDFLLNHDGMLNKGLHSFGLGPVDWLKPQWQFNAILVAIVWINTGYYVTILMAGVDRIPPYYYEEAKLAGTNSWQRFRHITLPMSWDVVGTAAVLWTIGTVKIFEFILAFSGSQGNLPTTNQWTSAMYVYGETIGGTSPIYDFGRACAGAVVTLVAVVVVVVVLRRATSRDRLEL